MAKLIVGYGKWHGHVPLCTAAVLLLLRARCDGVLQRTADMNLCNVAESVCVPPTEFDYNCTCFLLGSVEHRRLMYEPSAELGGRGAAGIKAPAPDDRRIQLMAQSTTTRSPYILSAEEYWIPIWEVKSVVLQNADKQPLETFFPHWEENGLREHLPSSVFRDVDFQEKLGIFVVNKTELVDALHTLLGSDIFFINDTRLNLEKWCTNGRYTCRQFATKRLQWNETSNVFDFGTEVVRGYELKGEQEGKYLFAYSTVRSQFWLPRLRKHVCDANCRYEQWHAKATCLAQCHRTWIEYYMPLAGQTLQKWRAYVTGMAVANFRHRFGIFFPEKPM